ncbi:outer membrane beta-barrel protein [Proteus alimentorum]|uniref:Outer membrane beta-barrel protein n=1 Tax=Proteus alimentorum TaxID=1973495 RepID=A0ABS0IUH3_9GAMM|nr:Ail/Lom family outer membrane beta-barrel protein [Proteus alimentorum]MBG2874397.1 outer membrane beta-barrel protein [Proteus alimentorum]MBG2879672.1 outer membrane beta-barrel protein [Proteus alimentorum]
MKNKSLLPITAIFLSIVAFNASATLKNTLSIGYAQSQIKVDGDKVDEEPKGFNIKYDRKIDNGFGIIGSFVYNNKKYDCYDMNGENIGHSDVNYYLFSGGPSYRFNEYINAYGLIGTSVFNVQYKDPSEEHHENKVSISYGLGLQVNPIPNMVIDASYEYSKLDDIKFGTWVLGVGYRF